MPSSPDPRNIAYLPLTDLEPDPANPKGHDEALIGSSIVRHGLVDMIVRDDRTGRLIAGHGRRKALAAMWEAGMEPPEGVRVSHDGEWLVPVVVGWGSDSDLEARAALIELNRTTEVGGWVDESLLESLTWLEEQGAPPVIGFGPADRQALLDRLAGDQDDRTYSRDVDVPHYQPTMTEPPPVEALADDRRTLALQEEIAAAGLPDEVAQFLHLAAYRHTVFRYDRIAEFYAHATPRVQALMEASALVIIDVADAIRLGYVRLSDRLDELLSQDAPLDEE